MSGRNSIIQTNKVCLLCGKEWGLHYHHIAHGTANRKIADQEGLTCWLCEEHHRRLHDKGENDRELQQHAQKIWMSVNDKTVEDWIALFGKSYLG